MIIDVYESLKATISLHSRDWSLNHRDAWLYGIICGWDEFSLRELKKLHGWDDETISRLIKLNKDFESLQKQKALTVQSTEIKEIVEHLNQVCKTNYKHTSAKTKTLVKTRLKDGFTLEDFKKVHITKFAEWYGTDMQKYLRPETLYGTKFESYLNQTPTDYEKLNAITSHTGLTPLQFLKQQGFAE